MDEFQKAEDWLREFFIEENYRLYSAGTRRRRSVLLELENDLQFSIGLPGRMRKLGLEIKEDDKLYKELPYVSPLLIYCSSIDVVARAYHKHGRPPRDLNGKWFRESAELFFGFSEEMSKILLNLRNSISHSYSINGFVFTRGHSESDLPIYKPATDKGICIVSTRKCLTSLRKARLKAYKIIMEQSDEDILKTAEYVSEHFIYYIK